MKKSDEAKRPFAKGVFLGAVGSLVVMFVAVCIFLYQWRQTSSGRNLINLEYGDSFEAVSLYDEGDTISALPLSNDGTVVFYLSSYCGTCIDSLQQYKAIREIWKDKISTCIIWQDDIPTNLVKTNDIPLAENYSLHQKVTLSPNKPTFYLIEGGKISFLTYDLKILEQKLLENDYMPKDSIRNNAFQYIAETLGISDTGQTLVYFCMDGCQDCEHADELISQHEIAQHYEIKKIYRSDTDMDGVFIDENDLLSTIFDVTWYPSFLICRSGEPYQIVGKVSDQKLLGILLK